MHARVTVHYPPGYGLHLFGAVIPIFPAPVLWVMAAVDLAATFLLWRRPRLWPWLVPSLVVSAYLTMVGLFSIGPIYFVLFWVQLVALVRHILALRRRRDARMP